MATSSTYKRTHAGIGSVGSYQVSGYPWISGSSMPTNTGGGAPSEIKFEFPRVTKAIEVIFVSGTAGAPNDTGAGAANCNTAGLRIHFNSTGSGNIVSKKHWIELNAKDESYTLDVKCKEVFISRAECDDDGTATAIDFRVVATLTNIPAGELSNMTGSGLTEQGE